jgi:hypothetical protein
MHFHNDWMPGMMPTQPEVTHALGSWSINASKTVDIEYCTHLAINWGCIVDINQDKNYDRESGQARSGINLWRGWT